MGTEQGAPEIRLWCAFYGEIDDEQLLGEYRQLLSESERAQERRFHFADDRRRYLVTRALVRTVLSRYVASDIAPGQWTFVTNDFGRPEIGNQHPGAGKISFNLSHTKDVILLGITCGQALGVDVENLRNRQSLLDIAQRFFAPCEVEALSALPAGQQQQRFFEYWTLKESYIKARGMGLAIALDQFGFRFPQDRFIDLSIDPRQLDTPARWRFWQLWLRDEYLAAVCAQRTDGESPRLVVSETIPLVSEKALSFRPFRASA
jgi:4'-phosphopantetheinyl transferase